MNRLANELKKILMCYATRMTCRSPTLVLVGPVRMRSPSRSKNS